MVAAGVLLFELSVITHLGLFGRESYIHTLIGGCASS